MVQIVLVFAFFLWNVGSFAQKTMTALVPTRYWEPMQAKLQTAWQFVDPEKASTQDLLTTLAIVPGEMNRTLLLDLLHKMPSGRLLQWSWTGTDSLNMSAVPAHFAICNVHQAGVAIPEYVLASVLSWNVRLPQLDAEFRRCTWHKQKNSCTYPSLHRTTKNQTIGIIGYGTIGVGVAERAAVIGMRAIAVTYKPPAKTPAPLSWIGSDELLPQLMAESDFIVVSCPLNAGTRGLVSPQMIGHMKSMGVLINIARGAIVDEAGLFSALQNKQIGGAVLDVWWDNWDDISDSNFWPSKFNFSALPNVWMTPHTSGDTPESEVETITQMAANFDSLALGTPLHNIVRNSTGENTMWSCGMDDPRACTMPCPAAGDRTTPVTPCPTDPTCRAVNQCGCCMRNYEQFVL